MTKKFVVKPPGGVIENKGGQVHLASGADAVEAFTWRTLLIGLRSEQRTGMRLTRGPSCKTRVKGLLGVKTNDYATLIQLVETKINQKLQNVLIVDRDEEKPEDYNGV